MHGEECHGAAQTGLAQIRCTKSMVCDAVALAVRADRLTERLRKISRVSAGTSMTDSMNLLASANVLAEGRSRRQIARDTGPQIAGTQSILTLRI